MKRQFKGNKRAKLGMDHKAMNHNYSDAEGGLQQKGCSLDVKNRLFLILWNKLIRLKVVFIYLVIAIFISILAKMAIMIGNPVKTAKVISVLVAIMVYSGTLVFPFVYVIKTAKYLKGVFYFWFIGWTSLAFFTIIIPSILRNAKPEFRNEITHCFPEELIVGPVFIAGWVNGLLFCGIAYVIRCIFEYYKRKKTGNNSLLSDNAEETKYATN